MKHLTVSLKERRSMPYIEYGEFKTKIIDMNKAVENLQRYRLENNMSMVIEVKAIRIDKHKELQRQITFTKDPVTGILYGIPIGMHVDGNIKWRKITLLERNTFDLNNMYEAQAWLVVRMHHTLDGSPFAIDDPLFEVYDQDVEADRESERAGLVGRALQMVENLSKEEVTPLARYMGIEVVEGMTPKVLRGQLYKRAMHSPQEFINMFKDPNRPIMEAVRMAMAFKIIKEDEMGLVFNGQNLGMTDVEVVANLKDNNVALTALTRRIKEIEPDTTFTFEIAEMTEDESAKELPENITYEEYKKLQEKVDKQQAELEKFMNERVDKPPVAEVIEDKKETETLDETKAKEGDDDFEPDSFDQVEKAVKKNIPAKKTPARKTTRAKK